jgi:hypothetical protein
MKNSPIFLMGKLNGGDLKWIVFKNIALANNK